MARRRNVLYDIETGVAFAQGHLRAIEATIPHLERAKATLDSWYAGHSDDLYNAVEELIKKFKLRQAETMAECKRREEEMEAVKNGV